MRRFFVPLIPLALALIAAAPAPAPVAALASAGPSGLWTNPHHSVVVRAAPCGGELCGTIVWASTEAQQDARDGGSGQLVGTELLRHFRPESRGRWSGSVFVPDMGRSFDSTIVQQGPNELNIAGCILHGMICKHQLWTRAA